MSGSPDCGWDCLWECSRFSLRRDEGTTLGLFQECEGLRGEQEGSRDEVGPSEREEQAEDSPQAPRGPGSAGTLLMRCCMWLSSSEPESGNWLM